MKIKVYENNIKAALDDDFLKCKEYFKSKNIDLIFEREKTNVKLPEYQVKEKLCKPNDGKYDIVMYLYDRLEQRPNGSALAENYSKNTSVIYLPTGQLEDVIGFHWYTLAHEIVHCLFHKVKNQGIQIIDPMDSYIDNNNPYSLTGNFAEAFKRLAPYLQTGYQYFSPAEVAKWKLKPELWALLDKMRGLANTPFIITSGLRTPTENANAGGKPNSSHLRGLAVDLACTDNLKRTQMLKGILSCGTPVFLEVARKHLHIDLDSVIHPMGSTIVEPDDN